MTFKLSRRSLQRLEGVHPDLVAIVKLAITRTDIDFTVVDGVRSIERQRQLVAQGASTTMNSRHLTGHAVDLAPWIDGQPSWHWPHYDELAPVIKRAAKDLGVEIEWGGDWRSFKDGPHWQLPWDVYAASDMAPRARLISAEVPLETEERPPKTEERPLETGGGILALAKSILDFLVTLLGRKSA